MSSSTPSSPSPSPSPSSPVATSQSYPNCSGDSDMTLIRQSFPSTISNDVDVDVDVDVLDIEKGQAFSVVAAAQQAQQQQQHSVTIEEVISRGLTTTTTEEDETAACRSRMMMMMQQENNSSSTSICIRISDLSHNVRKSVKELQLDGDGDGQLNTNDCLGALQALTTTQTKTHSNLKQLILGLCTFLMLLIVCVTALSITAVRMVQDTTIDPTSGIMYVNTGGTHGSSSISNTIMKTGAVEIYSNSTTLAKMTNDELDILKAILPGTGDVKFEVKGYARNNNNDEVKVLVEGGTLTYDSDGIRDATGNAKVLLTFAYGNVLDYSKHYRYSCNDRYVSGGGQQPHL